MIISGVAESRDEIYVLKSKTPYSLCASALRQLLQVGKAAQRTGSSA
ncbi:hypothetical protein I8751_12770 [Nostocaceae cyanobacterium CENA357]|uniref:Uncharacterized protein n=1 Tax=Atlanticothrix silvestris CENA357 TaxID=1725252 RepID=A0A8J7HE47_9CYAN|nr:hypothetical protein [Atlanticothrix silvestris]MBH8553228.1 hypothetical protein [Atlanticothrix silvestris CENA357]